MTANGRDDDDHQALVVRVRLSDLTVEASRRRHPGLTPGRPRSPSPVVDGRRRRPRGGRCSSPQMGVRCRADVTALLPPGGGGVNARSATVLTPGEAGGALAVESERNR